MKFIREGKGVVDGEERGMSKGIGNCIVDGFC